MLVPDLRKLLGQYKAEELRLIVLELYKAIPKKLREQKDVDSLLQDARAYGKGEKGEKPEGNTDSLTDFCSTSDEISLFLEYGYAQYYMAPNRLVHKKDRPKWRFKAKAYIKALQQVPVGSADGPQATELLEKLYAMLSYACSYYLFNSDNPYASVGIMQPVLFDSIIARKLEQDINPETIKSCISLALNHPLDRETVYFDLDMQLLCRLKTPDMREMAISQCSVLLHELKWAKPPAAKDSSALRSFRYAIAEKANHLSILGFTLHMAQSEPGDAVAFYKKNAVHSDPEITLYILLNNLQIHGCTVQWVQEYESAKEKGVKARPGLVKFRQYIEENGKMPDGYL